MTNKIYIDVAKILRRSSPSRSSSALPRSALAVEKLELHVDYH